MGKKNTRPFHALSGLPLGLKFLKPAQEARPPGVRGRSRQAAALGLGPRDLLAELRRYDVAHVREVPKALLKGVRRRALC